MGVFPVKCICLLATQVIEARINSAPLNDAHPVEIGLPVPYYVNFFTAQFQLFWPRRYRF
jgi:hypothetical protein